MSLKLLNKQKEDNFIELTIKILLLNYLLESFLGFFDNRTIIISFQLTINLYLILRFYIKFNKSFIPISGLIYFMIIYYLLLGGLSSNLEKTYNFLSKFLIPLFYFIIGFKISYQERSIIKLLEKSWIILFYFFVHLLLSNILGFGTSLYRGGFNIGFFTLNGIYIPTIVVLFVLFLNHKIKSPKIKKLNAFFAILTALFILLIFKRTFIIILALGLVFYILKDLKIKKMIQTVLIMSIIFSMLYAFSSSFLKSFESRQSRFNSDYSVTNEGRFLENIYIFNLLKKSNIKLAFGSGEVFNDADSIAKLRVFNDGREAHNSFIRILWNGGFLGLFVFILFYLKQGLIFYKAMKIKKIYKDYFYFGLVFVGIRFLNDFSSGITYLTFNAYSYFSIGLIMFIAYKKEEY